MDTSFSYEDDVGQIWNLFVVSDHKTGKLFASYVQGGNWGFYLVKEGNPKEGIPTELKSITLDPSFAMTDMKLMGVYDGVFAFVDKDVSEYKIKLCRYEEEGTSISLKSIKTKTLDSDFLKTDIKTPVNTTTLNGEFVDCFMNDKNIYLLYKYANNQGFSISTGGIVKCDYTVQGEPEAIKEVKKLISKDEYATDARNIVNLKDEKKEFYGPQRFVGFDEAGLYIADDGMTYVRESAAFQVKEHKNRLAYFDLRKESLSI